MKVLITQNPIPGRSASYVVHIEPGVTKEYSRAEDAFDAHPLATLSRRPSKPATDGEVRINLAFAEARRLREFMRCTVLSHSSLEDELLAALSALEI